MNDLTKIAVWEDGMWAEIAEDDRPEGHVAELFIPRGLSDEVINLIAEAKSRPEDHAEAITRAASAMERRMSRIETRLCRLMVHMGIRPGE